MRPRRAVFPWGGYYPARDRSAVTYPWVGEVSRIADPLDRPFLIGQNQN